MICERCNVTLRKYAYYVKDDKPMCSACGKFASHVTGKPLSRTRVENITKEKLCQTS